MVLEVTNSENTTELIRDLKEYITGSDGIMIAAGLNIYEQHADGTVPALFVMITRDIQTNQPSLRNAISFGNRSMNQAAVNQILDLFLEDPDVIDPDVNPFRGLGFKDPLTGQADIVCDGNNVPLYMIPIPAELLLAENVPGPTIPAQLFNGIVSSPDPILDLFHIQQEIIDGFQNERITDS
jgi:hypothetical protein